VEHKQLFTFALGEGHEIVMIRAIVKAKARALSELKVSTGGTVLEDSKLHDTRYYYDGDWYDAVIYDRNKLHEGLIVPSPAIVIEMDSTTVVLPGYEATVDKLDNLIIKPTN
jgi:N-methylhydantoinase A